jgi:inosine-uridine nucleoside N-ribohydrolase
MKAAIIRPTLNLSSPSSFLSNPTTSSTACSSIISSALFSTTTPTTTTTTTTTTAATARLWIDTDVGFDDLVAIGCCCGVNGDVNINGSGSGRCDGKYNLKVATRTIAGISTVGGGMTSNTFDGVTILRRLLFSSNDNNKNNNLDNKVVIVPGRIRDSSKISKIIPDPFWLTKCRSQMNDFCSSEGFILSTNLDNACSNEYEDNYNSVLDDIDDNNNNNNRKTNVDDNDDDDAATTFLSTTMLSTTTNNIKIDLICLGPLTNLAHWLERIPDFASDRLNSVWILGGNIPTKTKTTKIRSNKEEIDQNISTSTSSSSTSLSEVEEEVEAEFNFARDPEAVQTVLNHRGLHGKTIHIVPQEVCNRDAFERSFCRPTVSATTTTTTAASEIIDDWFTTKCQSSNNTTVSSLLPSWMVRLIRTRSFSLYGDPVCIYARELYLHNNDDNSNSNQGNSNFNDEDNDDDAGNKTKIRWKNYYTSSISSISSNTGNDNILEVDSYGRLVLVQQSATNMGAATTTTTTTTIAPYIPVANDNGKHVDDESNIDCNNCNDDDYSKYEGIDDNNNNDSHNDSSSGITIRVAHEIDLGPAYLDWLTDSLTATTTTPTTLR